MAGDNVFLGMRGTLDYTVEGQRPKNWRDGILELYPNGSAPLTALLSLVKEESTDDPEFSWFSRTLASQSGVVTGVFTNATLVAPVTTATPKGTELFVKMDEASARGFITSHTVILRMASEPDADTVGIVVETKLAGASSYIRIRLLEGNQKNKAGVDIILSSANIKIALIIGSAHAEGANMPDAITYDPVKWRNFTQIWRNSLDLSRTAKKTRLRTGDGYKDAKRKALEMHSIEMEKSLIFGIPTEEQAPSGKPIRTTGGLIWSIKNGNGIYETFDKTRDWNKDGKDWLDETFADIFRYGSTEKLAYAGQGTVLAINRLASAHGQWSYTTQTRAFGIRITEYVTPFGTLALKTHPLFSLESGNTNSLLVFEPKNIKLRYIDDTKFYEDDGKHGASRKDGLNEEFLTEAGLEYHHPEGCGWINGIGVGTT